MLNPKNISYLINHVIFPPRLPQSDDFDPQMEFDLLKFVSEELVSFQKLVDVEQGGTSPASLDSSMQRLQAIYSVSADGAIDEARIQNALMDLYRQGGSLPALLKAQNAGMLVTRVNSAEVDIEVFELSPENRAVMSTLGRLERSFPAVALRIPVDTLEDAGQSGGLAHVIAKMSRQSAATTKPKVRKAGQDHDEDRDTTHPKLVTELLMASLSPLGSFVSTSTIAKKTREDVLWQSARFPWRRSAMWLLIRVTLQLSMSRLEGPGTSSTAYYKSFMVFFIARILEIAQDMELPIDLLYVIQAKLGRRLLKMDSKPSKWRTYAFEVINRSAISLEHRWLDVERKLHAETPLLALGDSNFDESILHSLPKLEEFIENLGETKFATSNKKFRPRSSMPLNDPLNLPSLAASESANNQIYDLHNYELWVAENLGNWLDRHSTVADVVLEICTSIEKYHKLACAHYADDPEALSEMLLTILSLWKGCDQLAIEHCPLLQKYNPGIPEALLQSLILPTYDQMTRLHDIERYLHLRQESASYSNGDIFNDFGTANCFAVKFYGHSPQHQQLLLKIEEQAKQDRTAKRNELRNKQANYKHLMDKADGLSCEYEYVDAQHYPFNTIEKHKKGCYKCSLREQARNISISAHEWPLPINRNRAYATVFELLVPKSFAHWRDTTRYIQMNVFRGVYNADTKPRSHHTLSSYSPLSKFMQNPQGQTRIGILSENKPHLSTHRISKTIETVVESDICLNNGLSFKYYDNFSGCFTSPINNTEDIPRALMFKLPKQACLLQKYLFRPADQPDGPLSNSVIAGRHECPVGMSLDEHEALSTLSLGHRIQWLNILRQLAAPTINFKTQETNLTLLQCIYQVGPPDDSVLRASHQIGTDPEFAGKMLRVINEAFGIFKHNWECLEAMDILVQLITRLLNLAATDSFAVVAEGLRILADIRLATFRWSKHLLEQGHKEGQALKQRDYRFHAVTAALVCSQTFSVGDQHLRGILESTTQASMFIQCSMIISENCLILTGAADGLSSIRQRRWKQLSRRACLILYATIVNGSSECLDDAISAMWPAYMEGGHWQLASSVACDWLVNKEMPGCLLPIHANLLTGDLRIDGKRPTRLPHEFERTPIYQTLFGHQVIDVLPSSLPGMQYSTKYKHAEYVVHFGSVPGDDRHDSQQLCVRALGDNEDLILVPLQVLENEFPAGFLQDFVHWYDKRTDSVLFRSKDHVWTNDTTGWSLSRSCQDGASRWVLRKMDRYLLYTHSSVARMLHSVLSPLEESLRTHITFQPGKDDVEIDLPWLQLGFTVDKDTNRIYSKQFRDMYVDSDQKLGTLFGLHNRLILKHESCLDRKLLIPEGPNICCLQNDEHIQVSIHHEQSVRVHAFTIDNLLGRLVDNGSLRSKLFLCYLHALTSSRLCDPLTQKTGVEAALTILNSAAVGSFDRMTQEELDLLSKIGKLTPERQFYPANERVMQTVTWSPEMNTVTQHGRFVVIVRAILDRIRESRFFYPHDAAQLPQMNHVDMDLLRRDAIRTSVFYATDFGAEDHTTSVDQQYSSRDRNQQSQAAMRSFQIAHLIIKRELSLPFPLTYRDGRSLWRDLRMVIEMNGPDHVYTTDCIDFDAALLRDSFSSIVTDWLGYHKQLAQGVSQIPRLSLVMWLSTLAFAWAENIELITVMTAVACMEDVQSVPFPVHDRFTIEHGLEMSKNLIRPVLESCSRSFQDSQELYNLPYKPTSAHKMDAHDRYQRNLASAMKLALEGMMSQWPCESPHRPADGLGIDISNYIDIPRAMDALRLLFASVFHNCELLRYLDKIAQVLAPLHYIVAEFNLTLPLTPAKSAMSGRRNLHMKDIREDAAPSLIYQPMDITHLLCYWSQTQTEIARREFQSFLSNLRAKAQNKFEKDYATELVSSADALDRIPLRQVEWRTAVDIHATLKDHQLYCQGQVEKLFGQLNDAYMRSFAHHLAVPASQVIPVVHQFVRISPSTFLQRLSRLHWEAMSELWCNAHVQYALSLASLQQASRMLSCASTPRELVKELQNHGRLSWDPMVYPEWLVLEVENNITIRDVQRQIAEEMSFPRSNANTTLQLNMGEGKSSVIVPMVAAYLANPSQLVRVIVAKAQAKQMFHMLVSKLGGLIDRKLYQIPFSRDLLLSEQGLCHLHQLCRDCMLNGGVLLVQPEHLLSLKLMSLACSIEEKTAMANMLANTLYLFDRQARDVIDESDEIFNVKFELIYSMGIQQPIELSPGRWCILHQILDFAHTAVLHMQTEDGTAVEVRSRHDGAFPHVRLRNNKARLVFNELVAKEVCRRGLPGFPAARLPPDVNAALFRYMTCPDVEPSDVAIVEQGGLAGLWSDAKEVLFLLRGLMAKGILTFAMGDKRWRVDYGLDRNRCPSTRLAVPYRGKDSPSLRSQFSHPDVVLVLTLLSYYYGGLTAQELELSFEHLLKAEQADAEYQTWIRDLRHLDPSFRQLGGINLKDRAQFMQVIYPTLKHVKRVIDYFLTYIVFPKEMREFPHKLTSSGWDIGEKKKLLTTGFSGTVDLQRTLPTSVGFSSLVEQQHTNALVLCNVLRKENSVKLMPLRESADLDDAKFVLNTLKQVKPMPRVLLDVGAQVVDHNNEEMARTWLSSTPRNGDIHAVVYVNDNDELFVLDRNDRKEPLQVSPFAGLLDQCLIYLDEVHTRGIDLKLPDDYRAAVTLGPNVTKDRLVQACMRMRKLGQGQSVVFCVPEEIKNQIDARKTGAHLPQLAVTDVLDWAISETHRDLYRSMHLWAEQGRRCGQQSLLWTQDSVEERRTLRDHAQRFLEDDIPSLEQRYRPGHQMPSFAVDDPQSPHCAAIMQRCREFQIEHTDTSRLQEESIRELCPENERETEVYLPDPAKPLKHNLHRDISAFISTGVISANSGAIMPAFRAAQYTSAGQLLQVPRLLKSLWATRDFVSTVEIPNDCKADSYQRSVQWLLVGCSPPNTKDRSAIPSAVIIISPYEAENILASVKKSEFVSLHIYSPRPNLGYRPLDDLKLYTITSRVVNHTHPKQAILLLNLFAGQLYFETYNEYVEVCKLLDLDSNATEHQDSTENNEGAQSSSLSFSTSSSKFMNVFLEKIRKHGQSIGKTHLGKILAGVFLVAEDFKHSHR